MQCNYFGYFCIIVNITVFFWFYKFNIFKDNNGLLKYENEDTFCMCKMWV